MARGRGQGAGGRHGHPSSPGPSPRVSSLARFHPPRVLPPASHRVAVCLSTCVQPSVGGGQSGSDVLSCREACAGALISDTVCGFSLPDNGGTVRHLLWQGRPQGAAPRR